MLQFGLAWYFSADDWVICNRESFRDMVVSVVNFVI